MEENKNTNKEANLIERVFERRSRKQFKLAHFTSEPANNNARSQSKISQGNLKRPQEQHKLVMSKMNCQSTSRHRKRPRKGSSRMSPSLSPMKLIEEAILPIILIAAAIYIVPADAWRIFDVPDPRGASYGFNPFSAHKSQVLVPLSARTGPPAPAPLAPQLYSAQQQVSGPEPVSIVVERAVSGPPPQSQQVSQPSSPGEELRSAVVAAVTDAAQSLLTSVAEAAASNKAEPKQQEMMKDEQRQQQTSGRDGSSLVEAPMAERGPKYQLGGEAASGEPPKQLPVGEQVDSVGEKLEPPSLVGKILEGVLSSSPAAAANSSEQAKSGENLASAPPKLLLRPRKQGQQHHQQLQSVHSKASATEQQIINQHATSGRYQQQRQHQRLLPNKQRDNKIVSYLLSAASAVAGADSSGTINRDQQQQSALLTGLLSNLKTGISSRSSIVKAAISDNKLARTLSSVGKSIGSNKYVAGAAAASVLAALGIASKLLTPYLFAGSYAKLGDPMQGSSSYLNPMSYFNPSQANFAQGSTMEPTFLQPTFLQPNSLQAGGYDMAPSGSSLSQQSSPAEVTFEPSPVANYAETQPALYPTSVSPPMTWESPPAQLFNSDQQQPKRVLQHFRLTPQSKQAEKQPAESDINGVYTSYYDKQGMSSSETVAGNNQQASYQGGSSNMYEPAVYTLQKGYSDGVAESASQERPVYVLSNGPTSGLEPLLAVGPTSVISLPGGTDGAHRYGIVTTRVSPETKRKLYQHYRKQKPVQLVSSAESSSEYVRSSSKPTTLVESRAPVKTNPQRQQLEQAIEPLKKGSIASDAFVPMTDNSSYAYYRPVASSETIKADTDHALVGDKKLEEGQSSGATGEA